MNSGDSHDHPGASRTVETHITSVFTKLGLDQTDDNNRVRAVLSFLRSADPRSADPAT